MKIIMIGAGYVGLTTGACLAELGHEVTCIDLDAKRVAALVAGRLPIYEPGLDELVARQSAAGRLRFAATLDAVGAAQAVFLAVGTPSRSDGSIDLGFVERAARQIAPAMARETVVVVKSTVVAGTARRLREIIAETRGGLDFSVASNPEFLREGSAIADFMAPDRVVIGADDGRAAALLEDIYAPLVARGVPLVSTSTINAELIKYAANAMLALRIGFINEMADLCEAVGGQVAAVAEGIGLDRRIGPAFLAAGPGFGGSCFPKDTRALAALGRYRGAPLPIVETLIERNEARKLRMAETIFELAGPGDKRVAILGVAFKAETDDVRESAALSIIPLLQQAGYRVSAHDPQADAAELLPGVDWAASPLAAAEGADLVAILTDWSAYRDIDLAALAEAMSGDVVFDTRNIIAPDAAAAAGLRLVGVGRAEAHEARVLAATTGSEPVRSAAGPR